MSFDCRPPEIVMPSCYGNAFLFFLFLALHLLPVATSADDFTDATLPPAFSEREDVMESGVFRGVDDVIVRVVPIEDGNGWAFAVQELSGSSTVYLAEEEEGYLRPSRFSTQGFFAGHPMRVSGDGDRIYGFIDSKDEPIGFRYDVASREMSTSIGGTLVPREPASSREIELAILASDLAHTWQSMRSGSLSIRDDALVSDGSAVRLPFRAGGDAAPVRATYDRIGEVGDEDRAVMDQAMNLIRTTDASARSLDRAIQEAREVPAELRALEGR